MNQSNIFMLSEQHKVLFNLLKLNDVVRLRDFFECHIRTSRRLHGIVPSLDLNIRELSDAEIIAAVTDYLRNDVLQKV